MEKNYLNNEDQKLFNELHNFLKRNMALQSYVSWAEDLGFKGIFGKEFVLEARSSQAKDILEENYTKLFENGLKSIVPDRDLYPVFIVKQKNEDTINPGLNPRYTFDSFIVGSGSRFAYTAAMAVAQNPAKSYNPFLIYGGSGLGKTHLMHAIGHKVLQDNPNARVLYVTSEDFTNDLIKSLANKSNEQFRSRFRNVDVLLVDDIQFIAGKIATEEEFFHTFNTLYNADKQIVLTSDIHPQNMPTLQDRLKSRFMQGLIYDIQPPDMETRAAILRSKLTDSGLDFDDDALFYMASLNDANVRELEGHIMRVKNYSLLTGSRITKELVNEALYDVIKDVPSKKEPTDEVILDSVCQAFSVTKNEITGTKRSQNISTARQCAMYLMKEITPLTLKQIGKVFGGKDHSTVLYAIDKAEQRMKEDTELYSIVNSIREELTR